jgi:predicted lipase
LVRAFEFSRLLKVYSGRLKDLEIWRSSTSYFTNGITVHSGFKDLYQVHRDTILKYLQEIISTYPTYNVRITGHSLGGALATIMALDVQLNYNIQNVKLLTFGSPRVGNAAFASAFNASTIQHFRLVHAKDPVPHFPEMLFGFHHAAEEVWQVSDDSFSMCNLSGEDPNCSLSVGLPFSIDDHRLYLGLPTTDVCTGDQDTAIM